MKKLLLSFAMLLLTSVVHAQGLDVIRGDCTPDFTDKRIITRGVRRPLPQIRKDWDADKVYKQMVILVSFSDVDFQMENPRAFYNSVFNETGFNMRNGVGCVADYFRDQSGGLFNLKFDVYGPIKIDSKACPSTNPTSSTRNYGKEQLRAATLKVIENNPNINYKQYDWNGDKQIEQIIYVFAGLSGNQGEGTYGYIWPNTGYFSAVTTPDKLSINSYTASGELWKNDYGYFGIGTICHEFCHSLGLPDIYPTSSDGGFSVVDEWDLMDGGNFTNYGWCPPDLSPLEKMLLGWLTPVELTEPTTVKDLKPSADGGDVYIIYNTKSDYYLLENRQWKGWSLGLPGKGLVIYHVKYNASKWSSNAVNTVKGDYCYELVHADGLDYDGWDKLLWLHGATSKYATEDRMNSLYLSTSPFPWSTDSTVTVAKALTDTKTPISSIKMTDDGNISFAFRSRIEKCATPTIAFANGKFTFGCETEGVEFVWTITTPDGKEGRGNEADINTKYKVSVYATKKDCEENVEYEDSDTATMEIDIRDLKGDVNEDGVIDAADIASLVDILLHL